MISNTNNNIITIPIKIFGLSQSGKTSLILALNSNFEAINNAVPTTGFGVDLVYYKNVRLSLKDHGGSDRFWYSSRNIPPDGIVFICDMTTLSNKVGENSSKFDILVKYYVVNNPVKKNIPFLIIGNKIDKINNPNLEKIKEILTPERYPINYNIFLCSFLKNIGIDEAFSWFLDEILKKKS